VGDAMWNLRWIGIQLSHFEPCGDARSIKTFFSNQARIESPKPPDVKAIAESLESEIKTEGEPCIIIEDDDDGIKTRAKRKEPDTPIKLKKSTNLLHYFQKPK
jgi:hypothetical protein